MSLEAFPQLQAAFKIPISPEAKNNPEETVMLLQREVYFGVKPAITFTTLDCFTCVFMVCKGKTVDGDVACLASHVDDTTEYGWKDYLLRLKAHPIEIFLIGGEVDSELSQSVLENLIRYLTEISKTEGLNIIFRGQRILEDFCRTAEDLPFVMSQVLLRKATLMYRKLFDEKELPVQFDEMKFTVGDTALDHSDVSVFDDELEALVTQLTEIKKAASTREQFGQLSEATINALLQKYLEKFTASDDFNYALFCVFLLIADKPDRAGRRTLNKFLVNYAPDKQTFLSNLERFFCPLGFYAARIMFATGEKRIKYTQFAVSIEGEAVSISPATHKIYAKIENYYPRLARTKMINHQPRYVMCSDAPVLPPEFIALCDKYAKFFEKNTSSPEFNLLQIYADFRVAYSSDNALCDFLDYYANHRSEFAAVPKKVARDPVSGIKGGFFNKSTPPKKAPAKAKAGSELAGGFLNPAVKK